MYALHFYAYCMISILMPNRKINGSFPANNFVVPKHFTEGGKTSPKSIYETELKISS